jgi:hypothetical protein
VRDAGGFEVLRFEAVPAPGGVAILELEGAFAQAPPRRTRLLVERRRGSVEVPAVSVTGDPWTATFAVALEDLADPQTGYALVPDRGALIALPEPTGAREQDRYVRMARTANELRHRMTERAEAATAAEARAGELEADRDRLAGELEALRGELEAARSHAEDAERTAEACRAQRDSAVASGDERVSAAERAAAEAREALEGSRAETRAAAQRAEAGERDAAAQRARADAAEREAADLRERAEDEKGRADDLDERLVAAEDEVRAARRELRDTRARLEAMLRERRGAPHARHAGAVHADEDEDEPGHEPGDEDETAPLPAVEAREEDEPEKPEEPEEPDETDAPDEQDDDARFDSPRTEAVATRPTRTVRIWEDPASETGETEAAGGRDADVLEPGAVGARYIEPSERRGTQLTPERLIVGGILLVLVVLLLLILLGVF